MRTLDLTGLPVNDALTLARRKLDLGFAIELALMRVELIRGGVVRCDIEGVLERERAEFVASRAFSRTARLDY